MNMYQAQDNGKTPYENLTGKQNKLSICEMGEAVMHKTRKATGHAGNMEPRFEPGTFVGVDTASNQYLVADEAGDIISSPWIRRRPLEDR